MLKYERREGDTELQLIKSAGQKLAGTAMFPRIVSAALVEDAELSRSAGWSSYVDLVLHTVFWIFAYVMEVLVYIDVDKMANPTDTTVTANKVPFTYAVASLVLMTVSLAALLFVTLYHVFGPKLNGVLDAYLVTFIVAGVKVSFLFVVLISVFATSFATATDEWRTRTILSMISKAYLIQQLTNNLR